MWMVKRFEAFGKAGGSRGEEEEEEAEDDDSGDDEEKGDVKVDGDGNGNGDAGGLFERLDVPDEGQEEQWEDREVGTLVKCIREETEEGKKVTRNRGRKFVALFKRRADPPWPGGDG